MSGKRQKIQCKQLRLAFAAEVGVKPRDADAEGPNRSRRSEPRKPGRQRTTNGGGVPTRKPRKCVETRPRKTKVAPGVDGMTIDDAVGYLREHWPAIREQLLSGTYQPQPVKRVEIPKPDGGVRKLGVPCVVDRLIQQAVLQVLQKRWDPTFSEHSYGFRPGRSAHQAVAQAQQYVAEGYHMWSTSTSKNSSIESTMTALMARVAARVSDKRVLKLIRAFLNAGVMEDGLVCPMDEGTPQGGPLSPC